MKTRSEIESAPGRVLGHAHRRNSALVAVATALARMRRNLDQKLAGAYQIIIGMSSGGRNPEPRLSPRPAMRRHWKSRPVPGKMEKG